MLRILLSTPLHPLEFKCVVIYRSSVATLAPSAAVGHRLNGDRKPRTLWIIQKAATALEGQEHHKRSAESISHPQSDVLGSVTNTYASFSNRTEELAPSSCPSKRLSLCGDDLALLRSVSFHVSFAPSVEGTPSTTLRPRLQRPEKRRINRQISHRRADIMAFGNATSYLKSKTSHALELRSYRRHVKTSTIRGFR